MGKPLVAIVGRTNVGKSALFNRLAGQRIAVVEDRPGVTRDRLYATARIGDREVVLIDTGGLVGGEDDLLVNLVAKHAKIALQEADVLVFVVDGREGLTSHDLAVAESVRRSGKPYVLVANKMERGRLDSSGFVDLRLGLPLDISATHNLNIEALKEAILRLLPPEEPEETSDEDRIAIAVVGRPNVGKSSLVNALLGEERVIVSDIPGTTREAIDIPLSVGGNNYLLVDTAGLRRKSRNKEAVEFYSALRSAKAIERAHVVFAMLDASEGVTIQDQRIVGMAEEAGRAIVIIANKWDLVLKRGAIPGQNPRPLTERHSRDSDKLLRQDFQREVRRRLPFLDHAELMFVSATNGEGTDQLLALAFSLAQNFSRRIATGVLNRAINEAVLNHAPPSRKGRRLRIYYATQVAIEPPTIVCFVNDPELMHWSYERYLINFLRREFDLRGVPIRLYARPRRREQGEGYAGNS